MNFQHSLCYFNKRHHDSYVRSRFQVVFIQALVCVQPNFLVNRILRKNGKETLAEIKADESLKSIPVIVLTSSEAEKDIVKSYELQASCYLKKPIGLEEFSKMVQLLDQFWFTLVKLPPDPGAQ